MTFRRSVPVFSALAILGVVLNHVNWHVLSQFAAGDPNGYPYLVLDQIGKFAIYTFVFLAGFFVAYASNSPRSFSKNTFIITRIKNLIWPWLIWSLIMLGGGYFIGHDLSIQGFFHNLFIQYYFIPLLIFYYILAGPICRWAKKSPFSLLIVSACIQVLGIGLFYFRIYSPQFPDALNSWINLGPLQYLRFAFFFPFGVTAGLYSNKIDNLFYRHRISLLVIAVVFFILSVIETGFAYHLGGEHWPIGGDHTKASTMLFSGFLLLALLVQKSLRIPFYKLLLKIGVHSYGIYLSHYFFVGIFSRLFQKFLPGLTSLYGLYIPIIFLLSVGFSYALIEIFIHSPFRKYYSIFFG